jgi:flavin-dependent dehydrogenase
MGMQVDIIGGGLAGLATALSLKQHDARIDVIVHEKHKNIGYNTDGRRCGEAHNIDAEWMKWKPPLEGRYTQITHAETTIGENRFTIHQKPDTAWVLNRPAYIAWLGKQALDMGVEIRCNEKINDVYGLPGDFIVDASGCPSMVKRQLGLRKGFIGCSYQQTLQNASWYVSDTIRIVYDAHGGYFWVFPRDPTKKEINVGVGFSYQTHWNLKELLEEFKAKEGITGTIDHVTGGYIPIGLQYPLRYKNIFFVGDAGIGTYPLTGQGIYRAFLSGDVLGECIAMKRPSRYPHHMMRLFMKWDILGKSFLRSIHVIERIDAQATLRCWNMMYSFIKFAHL